jgi:6-phosphogluconolactonase
MSKRFVVAAVAALALTACGDDDGVIEPVPESNGAVFSMSNAREGNVVVAFSRAADGRLTEVGRFPTGGNGSGSFEDTANGMILGNAQGESSPNNLIDSSEFLFVTNAGSNSITVFRVNPEGLERVEVQNSGGEKPVSVTVNRGLLYVLHSGETEDDLFDEDGNIIPNCTTGELPSVTGFRVSSSGQLDPIPGSTRQLSGDAFSGCAQVSFSPSGDVLVVTERLAVQPGQENNEAPEGDEGVINTFVVNADGTLGGHQVIDAAGQGPFGFTFTKSGRLLTTEQFDGPEGPSRGAATSYQVGGGGTLTPISSSVRNGGTDTCWFVVTDDGQYGFTTSFFDPNNPDQPFPESGRNGSRISSYRINPNGSMELVEAIAFDAKQGASDQALSRDSRYLYQLNSFEGTINAFEVNGGRLTLIQTVQAHEPSDMAAVLGLAAS